MVADAWRCFAVVIAADGKVVKVCEPMIVDEPVYMFKGSWEAWRWKIV